MTIQFSNKILIVDDEEFNIDIIQEYLEEGMYTLISAINGKQGLELLYNNRGTLRL